MIGTWNHLYLPQFRCSRIAGCERVGVWCCSGGGRCSALAGAGYVCVSQTPCWQWTVITFLPPQYLLWGSGWPLDPWFLHHCVLGVGHLRYDISEAGLTEGNCPITVPNCLVYGERAGTQGQTVALDKKVSGQEGLTPRLGVRPLLPWLGGLASPAHQRSVRPIMWNDREGRPPVKVVRLTVWTTGRPLAVVTMCGCCH